LVDIVREADKLKRVNDKSSAKRTKIFFSNLDIDLCEKSNFDSNTISMLTPRFDGTHMYTVSSYAVSLAIQKKVEKVRIILTNEWSAYRPKSVIQPTVMQTRFIEFVSDILIYKGYSTSSIIKKMSFVSLAFSDEINQYLDAPVIVFKGYSSRFSCFLAEKSIYDSRPVVCATFSSKVLSNDYSDLILIRSEKTNHKQVEFSVPTCFYAKEKSKLNDKGIKVCSVYSGDRIYKGFLNFSEENWSDICRFLDSSSDNQWHFVGSNNVGQAISVLPKKALEYLGTQIFIEGRVDLFDFYKNMDVIVPMFNINGGGNGARIALNQGVVIMAVSDIGSDISNLIESRNRYKNFNSLINELLSFSEEPSRFQTYAKKIFRDSRESSDIENKGKVLLSTINRAIEVAQIRLENMQHS